MDPSRSSDWPALKHHPAGQSMTNVQSLRGEPIQTREANPNVVARLEALLGEARAGEIQCIAYAAEYWDDQTAFSSTGAYSRGLIGALALLQAGLIAQSLEELAE